MSRIAIYIQLWLTISSSNWRVLIVDEQKDPEGACYMDRADDLKNEVKIP